MAHEAKMKSANVMLAFATAEVRRLEEELTKSDTYKKLQAAKHVIEAYTAETHDAAHALPAATESVGPVITKGARIEAASADYLRRKQRRATSSEILKELNSLGIELPGKIPAKSLSAYLSKSAKFDNVPAFGGYGLVEWGQRKRPKSKGSGEDGDHEVSAKTNGQLTLAT